MKRFLGLLAASVAAIAIGCTAEPTAPVASLDEAATATPDTTPEIKLVSLSVPNMT